MPDLRVELHSCSGGSVISIVGEPVKNIPVDKRIEPVALQFLQVEVIAVYRKGVGAALSSGHRMRR